MKPLPYRVNKCGLISPLEPDEVVDADPRGFIYMWEPPRPGAVYVMGIDPSVGITGWDRSLRSRDDRKTDNGAIEIIRVGQPDVQVCEYAAPIDPEDLADVANLLGRVYGEGSGEEDGQVLCIIEVYPGPGLLTQRKLINHYSYTNHFVWKYLDTLTSKATNSLGWTSSPKSVRDLWIRCSRHINRHDIIIRSPHLVEEMADCEQDPLKMTAKAIYGKHDDRVRALFMAIWAAHEWSLDLNVDQQQRVETGNEPNWQSSDVSFDRLMELWEERFDQLSD